MVFASPPWAQGQLSREIPDSITVEEFMYNEKHGRQAFAQSRNPFTCGVTGRSYTAAEVSQRVDLISRALAKRLAWNANEGNAWDKVACVFSLNTVDYVPTTHAVHRLGAIVTPAGSSLNVTELAHQLRTTGTSVLFTCQALLQTALEAARMGNIARERIFILDMPYDPPNSDFTYLSALVEEGRKEPPLPPLLWVKGQGARQVAYLCFSSGTSGLPKGVMISHHNVISNIMQHVAFEGYGRKLAGVRTATVLGVLPYSHIYGLVIISHLRPWRGDEVVVLPRYNLDHVLAATQRYKIDQLCLVPPIVIDMLHNLEKTRQYDLSSVRMLTSGAAPLGEETIDEIRRVWPEWKVGQGYGLTESSPGVCVTSEHDVLPGTSGSIIPRTRCKLIRPDGTEVTELETPGELYVQSPSICLGYMNNVKATTETIVWDADGRWLRTGDVVVIRRSPQGNEHVVVVDRIKELIKVKGNQVSPAEIEAHLLVHPFVADCAVIPVPDTYAGEIPKAFVVKDPSVGSRTDDEVGAAICRHVEEHKARYKWLRGGVEFITAVPKSPSGKILRRMLRDREQLNRKSSSSL